MAQADSQRPRRILQVLGIFFVLWLATFMALPRLAPTRHARWLVATTSTLGALVARVSASDSGLLKNQLTTRLLLLEPGMVPLEQRAQGLQIGEFSTSVDHILPTKDGWDTRIGGDGLNARLVMRQDMADTKPYARNIEGFIRFSADIRRTTGWGIVVDSTTTGRVQSSALYVLDASLTLVVDPVLDASKAWYRTSEQGWVGEPVPVVVGREFRVGDLTVLVKLLEGQTLESFGHLLSLERGMAWMVGVSEPRLTIFRASARINQEAVDHAAVVLVRE